MKLRDLLNELAVESDFSDEEYQREDIEVSGISVDSSMTEKGNLFIALVGETTDGHLYIEEAERRGACAVVCQRKVEGVGILQITTEDTRIAYSLLAAAFYGNPQKDLKIIGVTGTNGKTTTCHYLASIIKAAGKKAGVIGTIGTFYADEEYSADLTTPDPSRLFALLSDMKKKGVEYVVMEVSAHAIYYKKTYAIDFAACIFTNCTQDHLDFFGTMENYKRTKKELFINGRCGGAILNADDPAGGEIAKDCKRYHTFALHRPADNFAIIEKEGLEGSEVSLYLNDEVCRARLRLTGRHNAYNALAAAACAKYLQIPVEAIAKGLGELERISGRLERTESVRGGQIFIDFAHTPDGLENALNALKRNCKGKLICAFGCGGNRDVGKRSKMGEIAGRICDFCVLTSDNPRYEEPYSIISEIEKGYRKYSKNYVVVQDRRKGIEYAIRRMRKNDVLLVAGKGGEDYQEIMGIKYAYNDDTVVKEIVNRIRAEQTE